MLFCFSNLILGIVRQGKDDFYSNGTEYEYLIQAKNGEIIARDIDGKGNGNNDMQDIVGSIDFIFVFYIRSIKFNVIYLCSMAMIKLGLFKCDI